MNTELLTPFETAAALKVTPTTLRHLRQVGTLQPVRIGYRTLRFKREDVERLARFGATQLAGVKPDVQS